MKNEKYGYAKPPKHSQFKPGHSGNNKGRPKGSKNTYKLLDDELSREIAVTQDGKTKYVSKKQAILLQAVNSAAQGNQKAIKTIFPHMLAADAKNEEHNKIMDTLSTDDTEIIKRFIENNNGS